MKVKIFEVLEGTSEHKKLSSYFTFCIMTLILLSAVAIALETVEPYREEYGGAFYLFEVFSVAIFTTEYILRVWGCTVDERYSHPIKGRIRFMLTPMAMIDLLAVAPFFLSFFVTDLRFVRVLRLLRIFRVVKLVRYSKALHTFAVVAKDKKEELIIVGALGAILIFLASTLMYFVEHEAQPVVFASIPHAMWWAVSTLTTVGYGDVTPITGLGKVLGAVISIIGIGMFALPAGILGSAFVEEFEMRRGMFKKCPHCDKIISDRRKEDRAYDNKK
ncbi:Potassium voltage-gated channel subfamily KQT; possible potassium channel, VIC family [hydrothermal vent metagenome]|uniref:Potassium voltage-gated channel subfamily KQT possible potassium channel, VIC family n=1 Tax=hydrothermal vent metagenome TaxID=652676 RepID=A0A3B1C3U1_9ZZZZ